MRLYRNTTGSAAEVTSSDLGMSRIFLRPIGSPLPLGMAALAGASVMLTGYQLSWLPAVQGHDVALAILLFAVPLQFLAAVFGYLGRDGAGGTGMALLGGCWTVTGVLTVLSPVGGRSQALGFLLFFASAVLLVPAAAAALGKGAAAAAFTLAAVRFALTGVYEYHGGLDWEHVSGWVGLALCVLALYNAFAFELEDTRHRTVLPVLRWGTGRLAMTGSAPAQEQHVAQEAGVREQL
jgi:succinate-acetate transporter protein